MRITVMRIYARYSKPVALVIWIRIASNARTLASARNVLLLEN